MSINRAKAERVLRQYPGSVRESLRLTMSKRNNTHHVIRQCDEYACSCGARWSVDEGSEHP